jgi:hypothetical protein
MKRQAGKPARIELPLPLRAGQLLSHGLITLRSRLILLGHRLVLLLRHGILLWRGLVLGRSLVLLRSSLVLLGHALILLRRSLVLLGRLLVALKSLRRCCLLGVAPVSRLAVALRSLGRVIRSFRLRRILALARLGRGYAIRALLSRLLACRGGSRCRL